MWSYFNKQEDFMKDKNMYIFKPAPKDCCECGQCQVAELKPEYKWPFYALGAAVLAFAIVSAVIINSI